jgi:hypothetical protein
MLGQTVEFESNQAWSTSMDRANGVIEVTGILIVWLIFFPPRFYQRWVGGAAPTAELEEA